MQYTFLLSLLFLATSDLVSSSQQQKKPHIIFIVADDLGWNDVSWHNSAIRTPNLERLAKEGVILNQSYVQPTCTPSRTAFMTGYYPFRTGRQGNVLRHAHPTGVPLKYTFLPEKLKKLGYATHLVGKWHLGYCREEYTPTHRGFDSFFGFYNGGEDHYRHCITLNTDNHHGCFLDFRNNTQPEWNYNGTYSSVPKKWEDGYSGINDKYRRTYSGMVTAMDDAIGSVVKSLGEHGYIDDSIIIFTTDNGGQVKYGGNNWPLRGNKGTLWEGGTRGVAFVHGKLLKKKEYVNNKIIHAVDWYATMLEIAGGQTDDPEIDSVSQWRVINEDGPYARLEIVYNIDSPQLKQGAIRRGDYKLIIGKPGKDCGWFPVPPNAEIDDDTCNQNTDVRLYYLKDDPTEKKNLADSLKDIVQRLQERLTYYKAKAVKPDNPKELSSFHSIISGNAFATGWCNID